MAIVVCPDTDCVFNRGPSSGFERGLAKNFCDKDYIVLREPVEDSCDDRETEDDW